MKALNRSRATCMLALLAACCLMQAAAHASQPVRKYSRVLGGEFYIGTFFFPGYGWHRAAGVISLDDDSPLRAAGVRRFDVITRLDGDRVANFDELDRHYCWTTIRYFRGRNGSAEDRKKTCFNRKFHIPSNMCDCR